MGTVHGPDRASLRDIWDGARAMELRTALDRGDFSLGCQECGQAIDAVGRRASLAHWFDRFDDAPYEYPRMIDFALSSRCNLACVMCNGTLSSRIRRERDGLPPLPGAYDDRFFAELRELLPHLERAQFKGGEPFLSTETQRVWDDMVEVGVPDEVAVTTNATVLTAQAEAYLVGLRMHPIVSVDGITAETLESIRVGVEAEALWRNVDRIQSLVEQIGNGMTLTFCLVPGNWHEMGRFLAEADRRGVYPNVVRVEAPPDHSLTGLTRDELGRIHGALADERQQASGLSQDSARIWQEVLDWTASLAEGGSVVAVGGPRGGGAGRWWWRRGGAQRSQGGATSGSMP